MKNKTKLNKKSNKSGKSKQNGKPGIIKVKASEKPVPSVKPVHSIPAEWLYMTDREIGVREIASSFESEKMCEIWEEAGVAEVILGGEGLHGHGTDGKRSG